MHETVRNSSAKKKPDLLQMNIKCARRNWGGLPKSSVLTLVELTRAYFLSVASGHVQLLDGGWYVTHSGLLRIAQRRHCSGIRTSLQKDLSDRSSNHWVFKATVYKSFGSKGFVGYGDADPSNTSPLVRGSEMRVAETRAVNRCAFKHILASPNTIKWPYGSPKSIALNEGWS